MVARQGRLRLQRRKLGLVRSMRAVHCLHPQLWLLRAYRRALELLVHRAEVPLVVQLSLGGATACWMRPQKAGAQPLAAFLILATLYCLDGRAAIFALGILRVSIPVMMWPVFIIIIWIGPCCPLLRSYVPALAVLVVASTGSAASGAAAVPVWGLVEVRGADPNMLTAADSILLLRQILGLKTCGATAEDAVRHRPAGGRRPLLAAGSTCVVLDALELRQELRVLRVLRLHRLLQLARGRGSLRLLLF